MTRKCLSIKRSVPSNSTFAYNDKLSVYFSNFQFCSNSKVYSFYLNTKKNPSVVVCRLYRSTLRKGFGFDG